MDNGLGEREVESVRFEPREAADQDLTYTQSAGEGEARAGDDVRRLLGP